MTSGGAGGTQSAEALRLKHGQYLTNGVAG